MPSKLFIVVPVYNEKDTVESVLSQVISLNGAAEEVVVVDDGSTDGSGEIIDRWARAHPKATVLHHESNRGYSGAVLTGFHHVLGRVERGEASGSDVLATIDADGQHDPAELPRLFKDMQAENADVVWGRRDFSSYPPWKRLGNWMMSQMARLFSGYPFRDVETGYCLFRLGALAEALKYRKRESRYSIGVGLAVLFPLLGYHLTNEPLISIRRYRSRTRLRDVYTDTAAAASAWAAVKLAALRESSVGARYRLAIGAFALAALSVIIAMIATHSVYLGYDSINNYVHVWYISDSLFHHGSIPAKIPWLDGGKALTYPYGFAPWTLAALLYRGLGDYATTWMTLLGFVLMLLAVYKTRMRGERWLFALFLIHPAMIVALLSSEMAFFWAALFGYLYIYAIEKNNKWWALLWFVLAVSTHMVVMGPLLALYTMYLWASSKERRSAIAQVVLLSLPFLAPVAWYALKTPSVGNNSQIFLFSTTLATVVNRASWFFAPMILVRAKKFFSHEIVAPATAAVFGGVLLAVTLPFQDVTTVWHRADNPYQTYLESAAFQPGATYRLLEASDKEQGHYYFPKHQGVLAQELFSESQVRISWDVPAYRCFLTAKNVDFVVANSQYDRAFHTNEHRLLDEFASQGLASKSYADPQGRFQVYDVRGTHEGSPVSVRSCFDLQ